jgi:hypothetical protein
MAIGVNWAEIWAPVWGPVWTQTPPVPVPDVVGETQAAGTAELEADGFVVAVATAYSSVVAAGTIISQDPVAGSTPGTGATVTITVSLGEAPQPPAQDTITGGGWYWLYDAELQRRKRRKRELDEAKEAVEKIDDRVDREIAELLQKQQREDEKRQNLERLRSLAAEFPRSDAPPRVAAALDRVRERQSLSALLKLDKELKRMLEEEELAVMMMLLND